MFSSPSQICLLSRPLPVACCLFTCLARFKVTICLAFQKLSLKAGWDLALAGATGKNPSQYLVADGLTKLFLFLSLLEANFNSWIVVRSNQSFSTDQQLSIAPSTAAMFNNTLDWSKQAEDDNERVRSDEMVKQCQIGGQTSSIKQHNGTGRGAGRSNG